MTRPSVFVPAGRVHCSRTAARISTVLGSCVSVCLWDHRQCIGGMNHFVLPDGPAEDEPTRYGVSAMAALLRGMDALGCRRADLLAKVFGGAMVLPFVDEAVPTVGERNALFAVSELRKAGIPLVAQRTGGRDGLTIRFHTWNGDVLVRPVPASI